MGFITIFVPPFGEYFFPTTEQSNQNNQTCKLSIVKREIDEKGLLKWFRLPMIEWYLTCNWIEGMVPYYSDEVHSVTEAAKSGGATAVRSG